MSAFARIGQRARFIELFRENNAFRIVVMPTSRVAVVFLLAMIAKAVGD